MLVSSPGLQSETAAASARSRQTRAEPVERLHQALAVLGVVLLHLLLFVGLMYGTGLRHPGEIGAEANLVVVLDTTLSHPAPSPPPPMPQAPARPPVSAQPVPAAAPKIPLPEIQPPESALPLPEPAPDVTHEPAPETRPEPTPDLSLQTALQTSESPAPADTADTTHTTSSAAATDSHTDSHADSHSAASAAASAGLEQRWQAELLRHLDRHLRYPQQARNRRQQGVVLVRFRIDANGMLHVAALERGSGHDSLDSEALAVLKRAQPLPPPPPELARADIDVVLPITFRLRRR